VKAEISREIIWRIKNDKWDFSNAQLQKSIVWSLRYATAKFSMEFSKIICLQVVSFVLKRNYKVEKQKL
jgi:hypothetical protein